MKALIVLIAATASIAAFSACDPCAGTTSCRTPARVAYSGRIVDHTTEDPVPGTVVSFIRTSGVDLDNDTVTTVSDGDGFFELVSNAKSSGDVVGTLDVVPIGRNAYEVPGIVMHTTTGAGDGGDLGRIVEDPYISYSAVVRDRTSGSSAGVPWAQVSFQRTGGIEIQPSVINTGADASGQFYFATAALGAGPLEGVFTISAAGYPHSYQVPVTIQSSYEDTVSHQVYVVNIGSALLWVGEIYRRGNGAHQAGIRVDFQRTSGIDVSPELFTGTTNDFGQFPIQPTPLGEGQVVGTITVYPPAPFVPFSVPGVTIQTMADDSVRLAGNFGYGAQALGALQLRYRTTNALVDSGAAVVFHATGGLATQPDSFANNVNQYGIAEVQLPTSDTGTVVGDLSVQLGEPYGNDVVQGIKIPSAFDDSLRFDGTYLVGRWFPQLGVVQDSVTRQGIAGAKVTFTRVDGVQFTPNPYTVTSDANGYFALRPQPLSDGDVVGDMTITPPAPYQPITVNGLHLHTSMDDTLHLAGVWLAAPQR